MPEPQETNPDKTQPPGPRNDLEPHASGEGKNWNRPRSTRDPSNDPTRCGHFGGKRTDGNLCVAPVIKGTKRCWLHSGITRKEAKAKGAVVLELQRWGIDGRTELADPGLTLLQLVSQAADRVRLYSNLLAEAYEIQQGEDVAGGLAGLMRGNGRVASLIGYRYGVDKEGNRFPIEEAIRGLVQLEAQERDRCAQMATKAIAAGLAERQVRMAEQVGMQIVEIFRRIEAAMEFSAEDKVRYSAIVARETRALAG